MNASRQTGSPEAKAIRSSRPRVRGGRTAVVCGQQRALRHFVGAAMMWGACARTLPAAGQGTEALLRTTREEDVVFVQLGERPHAAYRKTPNPDKVYLSELRSPSGVQVLLDSPPDHVHHHGLMYVVDAGPDVFWPDGTGIQQPRGEMRVGSGSSAGMEAVTLKQDLAWIAGDGRHVLDEQRRITFHAGKALSATLLTWDSTLSAPRGRAPVPLNTSRWYVGLGLRLPKSMDGKTAFMFPDGSDSIPIRNSERITRDIWCACSGPIDGHTVTVAMFSHPLNPREPTHWFTMSDALTYLSATLNLYRQPVALTRDRALQAVYGVAVWDGKPGRPAVEDLYRRWLALVQSPSPWDPWAGTHVNVARGEHGSTATASSVYGPDYGAARALDGKWAVRETDKWNSARDVTPHYLRLDLGRPRTVDRARIYHEGILPDGAPYTTADFRLQRGLRRWGPWEDLIPPVRNNTRAVTEHVFAPTRARYLRLLIETGEQDDGNAYGRILELEVYSPKQGDGTDEE